MNDFGVTFPDEFLARASRWHIRYEDELPGGARTTALVTSGVTEDAAARPALLVQDPTIYFCSVGLQPGDIVSVGACGSDANCGPGEVCELSATAGDTIPGLCRPKDVPMPPQCLGLLGADRRFVITSAYGDHLYAVPLPQILPRGGGCNTDDDCRVPPNPKVLLTEIQNKPENYQCRKGGVPGYEGQSLCVKRCDTDADCPDRTDKTGAGNRFVCDATLAGGTCVSTHVPSIDASKCFPSLTFYRLFAGGSLVFRQENGAFFHRIVEQSGVERRCVPDPTQSPFLESRIVLSTLPRCADLPATAPKVPCLSGSATDPTLFENLFARFKLTGLDQPFEPPFEISFSVSGGYSPLLRTGYGAIPAALGTLDGSVFVVDAGNAELGGSPYLRGQVIVFDALTLQSDLSYVVQ